LGVPAKEKKDNHIPVTLDDGGLSGLQIVSATRVGKIITITYSASQAYGTVVFTFTGLNGAYHSMGSSWKNTEKITKPRASSTWRFVRTDYGDIYSSISIKAERK
jgi:hypothetical protein